MTKFYFFILTFYCICNTRAQYTITSASNPAAGDLEIYKNVDSTGLQLGSGGAGQIWNYASAIINTSATSYTHVSISTVPNNSLFPTANIGRHNGGGNYSVFDNNTTKIDYLGSANISTTSCTFYSNSFVMLTLPFSYGSSSIDTYNSTSPTYTINGTFTVTGHGTGTLILPTGSYANVLKLRQTQQQAFITPTSTMNLSLIQDSYYSAINKFPLFSVGMQTITNISTTTSVTYNKGGSINSSLVTAIRNSEKTLFDLSVFPNPAHDRINLWFTLTAGGNYEISLNNLLGQTLNTNSYENLKPGINSLTADLEGLPSGIYFMKLKGKDAEATKKLIIE